MIALIAHLALQRDLAMNRHKMAKEVYWDAEGNQDDLLKVLLSRISSRLQSEYESFLKISADTVWLDERLVTIDLLVAQDLITRIGQQARIGQPVEKLFRQLGSIVGPSVSEEYPPNLIKTTSKYKSRILGDLLSHVIPASGSQHHSLICAIIETLSLEDDLSSDTCCLMMNLYAGLGDRAGVHRAFSNHELAVSEEFGETVSPIVINTYNRALESEPFPGIPVVHFRPPSKPHLSIGFDDFIAKLKASLLTSRPGDTFCLIGCHGAGKSHVLSRMWHEVDPELRPAFVECSTLESDLDCLSRPLNNCDFVLLENFDAQGQTIQEFRETHCFSKTIIYASCHFVKEQNVISVSIPRLAIGNRLDAGPAIELLLAALGSKQDTQQTSMNMKYIFKISEMTCGVPGSILACAAIIQSMGEKAAFDYIRNELSALTTKTVDSSAFSLRSEIINRLTLLSDSQLSCCQLLAKLKSPIATELLIEVLQLSISELHTLIELNIVQVTDSKVVHLESAVLQVLESSTIGSINPNDWRLFCERTLLCLSRRAEDISTNLELADSVDALSHVCQELMASEDFDDGLKMFCLLSKWFPSTTFPLSLVTKAELLVTCGNTLTAGLLFKCVNAMSSGYFFHGHYSNMIRILNWLKGQSEFSQGTSEEISKIHGNIGLGYKCMEKNDEALDAYNVAMELAPTPKNLVILSYNIACICESKEHFGDALTFYEKAASNYSRETDFRLLCQNTLSIIRLRHRFGEKISISEELIQELFREARESRDRISQATIMLDIGEIKFEQGERTAGVYYMIFGILLLLKTGFNKSSVSKILPTLRILVSALSSLGAEILADRIEVITDRFSYNLHDGMWEPHLDGQLASAFKEILIQCVEYPKLREVGCPEEIEFFIDDANLFVVEGVETLPVTSIVESIRAKNKSQKSLDIAVFEV